MGNYVIKRWFSKKTVRVLVLGLFDSGKTTILHTLNLGDVVTTMPTLGYKSETLNFKNLEMTTWDIGGREKIRPLLRHYYESTRGLVYVLDSSDRERYDTALKELFTVVKEEELKDVPVLVLANKQDIPGAIKPEQIIREIQHEKCMRATRWMVFGVSAASPTDHNLFEAFDWLTNEMTANEKRHVATKLLHGYDKDYNNNARKKNIR